MTNYFYEVFILLHLHLYVEFMKQKLSITIQIILAITSVILISALSYLFVGYIGYRSVALILLVTVSILASFLDILPVLVAASISALVWDFFFIPPQFTLHVEKAEDILLLVMYFVIIFVNAVLTNRIRKAEKEANEKKEKEKTI